MKKRWAWTAAAVVWMGVLFALSATPSLTLFSDTLLDMIVRKTGHFLVYALLAVLWRQATGNDWLAFVLAAGYAVSDEWHQTFVSGRHGWRGDVLLDSSGGLAGLWALRRYGVGFVAGLVDRLRR